MATRRGRLIITGAAIALGVLAVALYLVATAGPRHLERLVDVEAERVTLRIYRAEAALSGDEMRADLARVRVPEGESVTAVVYGPDAEPPEEAVLERLAGDRSFNAILQPPNDRWQWILKVNSRGERVIRRNR